MDHIQPRRRPQGNQTISASGSSTNTHCLQAPSPPPRPYHINPPHNLLTSLCFTGDPTYDRIICWAAGLVLICLIAESCVPTAYGRFGEDSSIGLDPRLGWWLMELPCSIVFVYTFFIVGGPQSGSLVPRLLAIIFCLHYIYRGWVFPFSIRVHGKSKNFSVMPAIFSWIVTSTHAFLNARWFAKHGRHLTQDWLRSPWFWTGAAVYYSGFALIIWHDSIVRDLRPCPNGQRYCIPMGGLFDYVTCAQYTVELWAWFGFWMMSCGPNGAFIFFTSLVNLTPRASATHKWYIAKFGEDYKSLGRHRLIPGFW